jgi:phosphoribosylformylglycinamidine cyclo-ligase
MAHITGGGLIENVPRIIPDGLMARFDSRKWQAPPVFELIQNTGDVDPSEMYRVFNMGLGMIIVCSPNDVNRVKSAASDALIVGEVVESIKSDSNIAID